MFNILYKCQYVFFLVNHRLTYQRSIIIVNTVIFLLTALVQDVGHDVLYNLIIISLSMKQQMGGTRPSELNVTLRVFSSLFGN